MSTLTIPASVVPLLREELLRESASAADQLSRLTFTGRVEQEHSYQGACRRLDAARALLARIGVTPPSVETSVELPIDGHASMAHKLAKSHYTLVLQRIEDACHEGRRAPVLDPALKEFMAALQRKLDEQSPGLVGLRPQLIDD